MNQDTNKFNVFNELLERFGSTCSAEQFYWEVNDAYHTVEAVEYDNIHKSMFVILDNIWVRALKQLPEGKKDLRILDIGSGTGLVGELLNRVIPDRIESLTCVEPNKAMIERIKLKSGNWSFQTNIIHGVLDAVPNTSQFDVITIDSVLHHIVDLEDCFENISKLLNQGGLLMTAQDPRGGVNKDSISMKRQETLQKIRWLDPSWVSKIVWIRVCKFISQTNEKPSLADQTNAILLEKGVINKPLDMSTIYAVTDVHVPGQPENIGHGIDVKEMKGWLKSCSLIDYYTYQFFGIDWENLSCIQRFVERNLWRKNDDHGFLFGSVWCK